VPPLAGFFSKDEILASAFVRGEARPIFLVAWGLGLAAALMTAYYMARLMAMTFFGRFRGGEDAEAHLHEAPAVMTGPLAVLGVLTVAGGLINLPAFAGGSHWLEHWLEPVTAQANALLDPLHLPHGTTELLLVGGAVLIAVVGLVLGFRRTLGREIPTPARTPPATGFARLLEGKYFVDELYQRLFVGPVVWLSRTVLWRGFDQFLVDRMGVGGAARVAQGLGWLGSRLQNGQVALYVTLFTVGAVLILRALMGG
jgi:NADH-quinone oxidoreductase subunit L